MIMWMGILIAVLGSICLILSTLFNREEVLIAMYVITGLLWVAGIAQGAIDFWRVTQNDYWERVSMVMTSLKGSTQEERNALGILFPHLNIQVRSKDIEFIVTGNATMKDLERFMNTSNVRQISPEREWAEGRDRAHWTDIRDWLISMNLVEEDSAAGSHSWLWKNNGKQIIELNYLAPYYIKTKRFADLSKVESA